MSSGVLAISRAKHPKPTENRTDDAKEQAQGPYLSITFHGISVRSNRPRRTHLADNCCEGILADHSAEKPMSLIRSK